MKSLWDDGEAAKFHGGLGLRVYTSRLLGCDPSLVLHGGGNTSVKIREKNVFGEEEEILYIKSSGRDLETIEETGFSPVRLEYLKKLLTLDSISDSNLLNEFKTHLTDATAATPSVESLLHAVLPGLYVDHTHADAFIAISNTENGADRTRDLYGDKVVIVPYIMSGFQLARKVSEFFPKNIHNNTIGMVVVNHGIFSFGESAKESYERMIELVDMAERYLKEKSSFDLPPADDKISSEPFLNQLAEFRKEISCVAGRPLILSVRNGRQGIAFARREDVQQISQQGPATPDHVIYTKRLPMLGRNVSAYQKDYEKYFETYAKHSKNDLCMLDPAPRVILDSELGLCTAGRTAKEANIASDIYEHTIEVILRAKALGGYRALSAQEIFNVEYWELEQAKLHLAEFQPVFTGEVSLVTGAASGIGKACVDSLLTRGSAVIGLDLDASVRELHERPDFLGIQCDVTSESEIKASLERGVCRFGGLDMLILNAGIFPSSREIADLSLADWRRVMTVNLDANLVLMRDCHPLLKSAPNGGRVVVIGSKNVPAPGKGAGAYSVSKAAVTQLVRVAAMEWGDDRIRINTVHPNAVFDTGVWTDEVLESRAKSYNLTVDEYKKNNLLNVEVNSRDIAEMVAEMCGPVFSKTTAAQVPVDGGNDRVV